MNEKTQEILKMKISKKDFAEFYYSRTNSEVCKHFNISQATLWRYLKKHKIPMKGKENAFKYRNKSNQKIDIV